MAGWEEGMNPGSDLHHCMIQVWPCMPGTWEAEQGKTSSSRSSLATYQLLDKPGIHTTMSQTEL